MYAGRRVCIGYRASFFSSVSARMASLWPSPRGCQNWVLEFILRVFFSPYVLYRPPCQDCLWFGHLLAVFFFFSECAQFATP